MMKLHELLARRAAVVAEMRTLNETAEKENRDYTPEEDKRHGELKGELAGLDKKIERAKDLQEAERAAPAILHSGRGDGNFEDRARDFSVVRAIRAAMGERVDDGFEREMSAEVRRRAGREFSGIAVPEQVLHAERRTLLVGSSAADLVPNVHRPDLFIDRLRAALVVGRLGATVLSDLAGSPIDIPKQTGSSTAQWVAEDGSLTETDAAFTDISLTPKTVGAMTSYSRRTLLNTSPSIEQIVRNDLASVIANAIDYAAMAGTGTGNTPTGIIHSGAAELSFSTPSWAEALAFPVHAQNLDADIGGAGWATTPHGVKVLMSTPKIAGSPEHGFIMDTRDSLAGYPVATTTALRLDDSPETAQAIFGHWSQLIVGYWTGLDILVNPYETTAYAKGRVLVRAMRDCDVQVRHVESFAFADNLAV